MGSIGLLALILIGVLACILGALNMVRACVRAWREDYEDAGYDLEMNGLLWLILGTLLLK